MPAARYGSSWALLLPDRSQVALTTTSLVSASGTLVPDMDTLLYVGHLIDGSSV